MSTLGGSRGERQAKPKFAALNINQLYKNSRGESLEPSTQKNQVPRKHGMQSLGKVPSARRPPANLPSLKAEINSPLTTPEQQGGSQTSITQKSTSSSVQSANSINSTTNISNVNNNLNTVHSSVNNSSTISTGGNNNSGFNKSLNNNSSGVKSNQSGGSGNNINSNNSNNISTSSSSITWSSVTTGGQDGNVSGSSSSLPPHYQSPQFQYEFPSLDGSNTGNSGAQISQNKLNANQQQQQHQNQHLHKDVPQNYRDGNTGSGNQQNRNHSGGETQDTQQVSLRPQTDTASWIQHQQSGNGGKVGDQNQKSAAAVPIQYRSLMPSFMYRGGPNEQMPSGGGGSRSLTPPMNQGGGGGHYQTNGNYSMGRSQRSSSGSLDHKDYHHRTNSPNTTGAGSYRNNPSGIQKRPSSTHTPPGGGLRKDASLPYVDIDVALNQRPIIREEDLERMDSIAKDDGWTKQDDIDYNQKLTFSDDESPEPTPSNHHSSHLSSVFTKDKKAHNHTQYHSQQQQHYHNRERHLEDEGLWSRSSGGNERDKDRENLDRERNERNDRERQDEQRVLQQNGNRTVNASGASSLSGGLESAIFERVKQRKEEEDKRELERKQGAAKKLQELEMKMKKSGPTSGGSEDYDENKNEKDEDYSQRNQIRSYRDSKDKYGRYDKYDRGDRNNSSSSGQAGQLNNNQTSQSKYTQPFQSNLPPRFLKQQQSQLNSGQQQSSLSGSSNYNQTRSITANNQQSRDQKGVSGSTPFSQTYDTRHIQTQNYKQPQPIRRNPSSEEMMRRGGGDSLPYNNTNVRRRTGNSGVESEEDDRFSNTSSNRNQEHSNRTGNNLTRSISGDSTNAMYVPITSNTRKTSVSSNDDQKLSESFHSMRSSIGGGASSWAEETDAERHRNGSFSSDHNQSGGSVSGKRESSIDDIQPKQILQRPQTKSMSESSKKDDEIHKKEDDIHKPQQLHQKSPVPTQILRRSESPQDLERKETNKKAQDTSEKKIHSEKSGNDITTAKDESKKDDDKFDDNSYKRDLRDSKRPSSRGGGSGSIRDMRDNRDRGSRGSIGYGSYRGSSGGGGGSSWSRRGGSTGPSSGARHGRNYSNDHWSESGDSDDDGDYRRLDKNNKVPRKDGSKDPSGRQKEGFAPRGEPSRRGRGGSMIGSNNTNSSYRRTDGRSSMQSSGTKRVDSAPYSSSNKNYNSSSQQSHSLPDEKSNKTDIEDKTKLNQLALTSGLQGKKEDDNKNKPSTLKALSPQIGATSSSISSQVVKRDDKKSTSPKSFANSSNQNTSITSTNSAMNYSVRKDNVKNDSDKLSDDKDSMERKKSLSKEKELAPQTQRSQSSGHISTVNRSGSISSQYKKDDRNPQQLQQTQQQQKTITKPPPGLGFKTGNNPSNVITNNSTGNNNQQNVIKDQHSSAIIKSKSSGDARSGSNLAIDLRSGQNSRNNDNKNISSRVSKQWEPRSGSSSSNNNSNINNSSGNQQQNLSNSMSAWEKPIQPDTSSNVKKSDHTDNQTVEKSALLDGNTAPLNTIIFENTNYKTVVSTPMKHEGNQQQITQKKDDIYKSNASIQDLQNQQQASESITTALSQMTFGATATAISNTSENDYDKDMKLGFAAFDNEFSSHLNDDNKNSQASAASKVSAGLCLQRQSNVMQHSGSTSQNTISPSTADLNMKIASVKKVWENVPPMPTVMEHSVVSATVPGNSGQQQSNDVDVSSNSSVSSHLGTNYVTSQQQQQHLQHIVAQAHAVAAAQHAAGNMHMPHALSSPGPPSYGNTFDPTLEHFTSTNKDIINDTSDPSGYSPSPQHMMNQQQHQHQHPSQTNLALKHAAEAVLVGSSKVKTSQQQQQLHQSVASLGLSPPPALQQQQQNTASNAQLHQQQQQQAPHQFYQPSQYNTMPTIPSPPAVMFNSSQGGLYTSFQLDPSNRSQFSQFPGHYGTAGSGPYNAYMQTAPNMQTAPAPEMYPNLTSQFRMSGGPVQTAFNQTPQQLSNPNTVLISSNSNSLMSATVKNSSQQIGAIGSKSNVAAAAAAAQPFGQQYMNMYTQQAPPPPPPQLQSNSYYSNSGGGQGGFYGGPSNSAQNYGLQAAAGIFGGHGAPPGGPSSAPPPPQQMANFNSQFINSPLLAGTMNQYRGGPNPQTTPAYMKSNQGQNHMQDSMGRQLKSPLGSDVSLNLAKQVQSQQSPPHHKSYAPSWDLQNQVMQQQSQNQNRGGTGPNGPPNSLQSGRPGSQGGNNPNGGNGSGGGGSGVSQRYPTPIQRPTNYPHQQQQQANLSMQQSQQSRPLRHPGGPPPPGQAGPSMNKHYYGNATNSGNNSNSGGGGNRGHTSNSSDQQHKHDHKDMIVNQTSNQHHHHQQQQQQQQKQSALQQQQQQQQQQHQKQQSDLTVKDDSGND